MLFFAIFDVINGCKCTQATESSKDQDKECLGVALIACNKFFC